jgi:hypothetical protein
MTSTSRQSIATLAADLQEVLAWGYASDGMIALRDNTISAQNTTISDLMSQHMMDLSAIAEKDATIAAKDAEIATLTTRVNDLQMWNDEIKVGVDFLKSEIARLTALLRAASFTVYNEMKSTGPIPGWPDILVIYESELFPSSVPEAQRSTTPPDTAFLDAFFANLFAQHGDVRLVLDSEAWRLITDVDSPTGIDMTVVGWYVTLVSCAKNAGFTNVGLYGEITERATLYLNYPVGHATHELRKSNWQARNAMCQPMWDAVDTIYPSFYPIKPIHNDAAKRDAWMDDNLAICRERAPGKPVIPFLMARVHPSADETKPYLAGAYWRAWLEKVKSAGYDGLVVYQNSTDPDPLAQSLVPDWHLQTEAFIASLQS